MNAAPALERGRNLRKRGALPGEDAQPEHGRAPDTKEGDDDALVCAACRRRVTSRAERIEVNGGHEHDFKNPSGVDFRVGCFARAPGCEGFGETSRVWTWFPGYAWRVEVCGGCRAHLGWSYAAPEEVIASFFALILGRLVGEG